MLLDLAMRDTEPGSAPGIASIGRADRRHAVSGFTGRPLHPRVSSPLSRRKARIAPRP